MLITQSASLIAFLLLASFVTAESTPPPPMFTLYTPPATSTSTSLSSSTSSSLATTPTPTPTPATVPPTIVTPSSLTSAASSPPNTPPVVTPTPVANTLPPPHNKTPPPDLDTAPVAGPTPHTKVPPPGLEETGNKQPLPNQTANGVVPVPSNVTSGSPPSKLDVNQVILEVPCTDCIVLSHSEYLGKWGGLGPFWRNFPFFAPENYKEEVFTIETAGAGNGTEPKAVLTCTVGLTQPLTSAVTFTLATTPPYPAPTNKNANAYLHC